MQLDVKTILITLTVVSIAMGIMLMVAGRITGLATSRFWASGYFAIAVGTLLVGLRGLIWDYISIVVANAFTVLALAFFWHGIARLRGSKQSYAIYIFPLTIFVAFNFLYKDPDSYQIRILLATGMLAAGALYSFVRMVQKEFRTPEIVFTASFFLFVAIAGAGRVIWRICLPPERPNVYDAVDAAYFLSLVLFLAGIAMGFLLITNRHLNRELARLAYFDVLTELFNRRAFLAEAQREATRCERKERPYSVLMCDLDRFKAVNDRFGHDAGDQVLRRFADVMRIHLRETDVYGRYGGEEFCVLLPETTKTAARRVAERLRSVFAEQVILLTDGEEISCTVSIGLAENPNAADTSLPGVIRNADLALYGAKAAGRNCVKLA
ncbi:MAG: GGDEF domain-containing protein [Spirochaetia bacterium]|nr:GGDEF domain-containing protein [Spirochaetia bacterium]